MNDFKTRFEGMFNELKQERDELKVKLHLAKLETGDEWEKLEAPDIRGHNHGLFTPNE